ncbi:MAG: hypothetical protein JWN15_2805, partial [Firmicutes bacterium]|nr:hypothetical protein [Bacillota bacterium]
MIDKALWRAAKEADYAIPAGYTTAQLVPALLDGLCSTDPELRDSLSYELLATWVQRGHFSPAECREMLPQLLANLRMGPGEGENDQVFGRTFSVLILAEIIAYDGKVQFLNEPELQEILEAGLQYLAEEQDLRGYVPD